MREIMRPTIKALAAEGAPYSGVLYGGLMITRRRPQDHRVQLPPGRPGNAGHPAAPRNRPGRNCAGRHRAQTGQAEHRVEQEGLRRRGDGVGRLSRPLPDRLPHLRARRRGQRHHGIPCRDQTRCGGPRVTAGGRVLTVVATGETLAQARQKVYNNISRISFEGAHYRKDIALFDT